MKKVKETLIIASLELFVLIGFIVGGTLYPTLLVARIWYSHTLFFASMRVTTFIGKIFGIF